MDRMARGGKFYTTVCHQLWRHFRSSLIYYNMQLYYTLHSTYLGSIKLSKQAIAFTQEQEGNNILTLIFI